MEGKGKARADIDQKDSIVTEDQKVKQGKLQQSTPPLRSAKQAEHNVALQDLKDDIKKEEEDTDESDDGVDEDDDVGTGSEPDTRADSDETTSEDDDEDVDWADLEEGSFIELVGTLNPVRYGLGRWAISVAGIEPGYFRYSPILQRALFPLLILVKLLVDLSVSESGEGFIDEETVLARITHIQSISNDLGLTAAINSARDKALRQIKAINSLAVLTHADDVSSLRHMIRVPEHLIPFVLFAAGHLNCA